MVAGKILETISDGDWHSLEDVAGKLNASVKDVVGEVITLSQFGVVVYDEMACKVKLSPWILNLSERGGSEGRKSAVGSIVLPPKGYVTIQDIAVSNFLDEAVELGVILDKKVKEISISKVE